MGFPRTGKKNDTQKNIQSIHDALSEFIKNGGDIKAICHKDQIYKKVKNTAIVINGSTLSVAKKFELAGFPREEKYNPTRLTISALNQLDNFKDADGYVDSYRNNKKLNTLIDSVASYYDLPISLVITLLGNKKLKSYTLNIDRYDYLKTCLAEYVSKHGDFIGIKQKDERLYNLLTATAKTYPTRNGEKITTAELVKDLGFCDVENNFRKYSTSKAFNPDEFINKYRKTIINNGNKIYISDFKDNDYQCLINYLRRNSLSITDYFASFGVDYKTSKNVEFNKKLKVSSYPYLKEMKAEVNSLLDNYYHNNPNFKLMDEETLLKNKVTACQFVYGKFKPEIQKLFSDNVPEEKTKE